MPRMIRGSIYTTADGGTGIRWPENGKRPQQEGFANPTEARVWFDENVAPRLRRKQPSGGMAFEEFCVDYLTRWGADVSPRTKTTVEEWLIPARAKFGTWKLRELEGAADDIAAWRSKLPTAHQRYKHTRALRQVLAAAVRWGYLTRNPAKDMGSNPQPRTEEIWPFSAAEIQAIVEELRDEPRYEERGKVYIPTTRDVAIVIFGAETGLRTNEWTANERRDIDRHNPAVAVARRFAEGRLTPYPKTTRRRVPLTPAAIEALEATPTRMDSKVLFPNKDGDYLDLNNWRNRIWYPALEAAGVAKRGPYHLRHTFATNALAKGVSIFQLARVMGASVETIDRHYGHLTREGEDGLRTLLSDRSGVVVALPDRGDA